MTAEAVAEMPAEDAEGEVIHLHRTQADLDRVKAEFEMYADLRAVHDQLRGIDRNVVITNSNQDFWLDVTINDRQYHLTIESGKPK